MVYVSWCCISRYRPRNTRIKMVQAKRKALDMDMDGKCCLLRTRKASLALRKAENAWMDGMRSERPHTSEFEHRTARQRRKEKKRACRWKSLELSRELEDIQFAQFMSRASESIEDMSAAMGMAPQEVRYALGEVYKSYDKIGKKQSMATLPIKKINWVQVLPRYVREWVTTDLKYRLDDIHSCAPLLTEFDALVGDFV